MQRRQHALGRAVRKHRDALAWLGDVILKARNAAGRTQTAAKEHKTDRRTQGCTPRVLEGVRAGVGVGLPRDRRRLQN